MNNRSLQHSQQHDSRLDQPLEGPCFVTFRLVGTMSRTDMRALKAETKKQIQQITVAPQTTAYVDQMDLIRRQHFGRWDSCLGKAEHGPTWLRAPQVARVIWMTLLLVVGQHYDVDVFCIMPNHVHLLLRPFPTDTNNPLPLSKTIQGLKRGTAVAINRILGRKGQFWHHENITHLVRDNAEARRISTYIIENPVKAGLVANWDAWPWTYLADTDKKKR